MKVLAVATAHLRLFLLVVFSALGLVACGGGGGGEASLTGVEITPANASKVLGSSQQYAVMAIYSNNSKVDVSSQVTWSSSDPTVATISSSGLAQTLKTGTTTISASYMGQSIGTPLTVTAATVTALAVTPANASLAKGSSRAYTATATFTDRTTQDVTNDANWTSTTTSVATVGNAAGSKGRVTAVSVGSSTIGASFGGASGSTGVTVTAATLSSIEVTPANSSVPKGTSRTLTATGVFTDGTTQNLTATATWASASPAVATVGNTSADKGKVTGVEKGQAVISATASGVTGSTTVTVSNALLTAIQVTPANASRPKGAGQQYTATGTFSDSSTQDVTATVVWSSSDTTVATISNAEGSSGMASTLAVGTTTISAASGAIASSTGLTVTAAVLARIDITPSTPSIPVGTTEQFTATGVYTDGVTQNFTTQATWASSDTAVLEISNGSGSKGFSAANAKGTSTVSASHMGMTGSTQATVSDAAIKAIQINPPNGKVAKNFDFPFTATATFSDNTSRDVTNQVTWSVTDAVVATISNADGSRGVATAGGAPGTTNVRATAPRGGVFGTASLQVTDATLTSVAVTPANPSVPVGLTEQLRATGTFSDSTTQILTRQASWTSADPTIATVNSTDAPGRVQGAKVGSTDVRASVSRPAGATAVVSNPATVQVTGAKLQSLVVLPDTASVAKGSKQAYSADGRYSDGDVRDVTTEVTWSSSAPAVATISNASGEKGVATAVAVGTAVLKAAYEGVEDTAGITVTDAELTKIAVTPNAPSIAKGRKQQFAATGTYTDGSSKDITASVVWASATPAVATISNATADKGVATSGTKGSTDITAASGSITSDAAKLTVTDAVPVSIAVTPANTSVPKGESQQYIATTTYSDGTTGDQTKEVTWASTAPAVATIGNADDNKGKASAVEIGNTEISATDGSISGKTGLTVSSATLQSIQVTSECTKLPVGYRVKFLARGVYSDFSNKDISADVDWSTLTPAVATVNNTGSAKGEVTTVAVGSTSVRASLTGREGTLGMTVTNATLGSIAVTPANHEFTGPSSTQQYTATATFSDAATCQITNQVNWASSTQTAATINATTGLATGGALPGNTNISATKGSVSGQTPASNDPSPAVPGP